MATWETTFYYQQELRSTYMNNIINGLIRPGIYNMDAAIYAISSATTDRNPGIYLRINAGAVLVFSNNFKTVNNVRVRDDNTVGTYLIKCVLKEAADIPLSTVSSSGGSLYPEYLTSPNRIPVVFVTAIFSYDPEGSAASVPEFKLVIPKSYREGDYQVLTTSKLPNEDLSTVISDVNSSRNFSYLIMGALIDRSVPFGGFNPSPYVTFEDFPTDNRDTWMSNHVFTGRAFPEYRESVLKNYGTLAPNLGFSPFYKNMYLTPGQFYYNGILYSISGTSWKNIYGQNDVSIGPIETPPSSVSGFSTDGIYVNADATSYIENAENVLTLANAGKLVAEFLFMALRSEYSTGGEGAAILPDLTSLFTSNDVQKKLIPFRVVCDFPSNGINLNTLDVLDENSDIHLAFPDISEAVIPLDVSIFNINRLKKMLLNKNIVLPVIDALRQYGDTRSPYFVAGTGDALLPLMVSFRKINASGTDYIDAASSTAAVRNSVGTTFSAVNPANILTFFELQANGYTVMGANLATAETFTTLPFLGD